MTKKDIVSALASLKAEVREHYKAEIKGIFGSFARDEDQAESDIDILVEFYPGATLLNLAGLGDFLEENLHHKVDLVSERAIRKEIEPYIHQDLIRI